jgi:hypothetical protein
MGRTQRQDPGLIQDQHATESDSLLVFVTADAEVHHAAYGPFNSEIESVCVVGTMIFIGCEFSNIAQ